MPLTGAEKSRLRGRGQTLDPLVKIGHEGASAAVVAELERALDRHELVKVRYVAADRDERAVLTARLIEATGAEHVGSVGATALFYRLAPSDEPTAAKADKD